MALTIKKLYQSSSTWYAQDIAGNIAFMALEDSYMPEYIIEDEQLYYQLDEYMTNLWNKYDLFFSKEYSKNHKKKYILWLKENYKGCYCYRGNCEYWQIPDKECTFKKYISYDCMPEYNRIKLKINEIIKINIDEIPEKFHDIIPKYKINFEDTEVIEDASKFSLPDSYAKKKYPWLNT